jgi:hypothetical protein
MTLPDMLMIDGVEYRRADRDEPVAKDPTAGHSPLPWVELIDCYIGSSDGKYTCEAPGNWTSGKKHWPANRALILRAVNHHADLVAFVERVANYHKVMPNGQDSAVSISNAAKILLTKVKGT